MRRPRGVGQKFQVHTLRHRARLREGWSTIVRVLHVGALSSRWRYSGASVHNAVISAVGTQLGSRVCGLGLGFTRWQPSQLSAFSRKPS